MKLLGIDGSPRKDGNSHILLDIAMKHARELGADIEVVHLRDYEVERCRACGVCGKKKNSEEYMPCVIKDEATDIFKALAECDGFILATPVYFGLPTPLVVDFMNRSRFLRHQDFALDMKVFGVITVAGRRSGGNETAILSTWLPWFRNGCIPVGNGDKSCQFGVAGWAGAKGDILKDQWGIQQALDLADRVYNVASVIASGNDKFKNRMRFDYPSGSIGEFLDEHP